MAHSQREKALQYLLGELPEQHAVEFEAQYFTDDNLFEETCALENELIDSFVRDELSETQRQQFERGYLISPARRAHLEFSRLLSGHVSAVKRGDATAKPSSAPVLLFFQTWPRRLAWMTTVALAIAGVSCMMVMNRRLRQEVDSLSARQAEFQHQEQSLHQEILQLETLHPSAASQRGISGPRVVSLFLTPGGNRGGGEAGKIVIGSATPLMLVHLYIERDEYRSYRAFLQNGEQRPIWENNELKSHAGARRSRIVTLQIRPSLLHGGDYLIRLEGKAANGDFEPVEDYQFQVVRR